MNKKIDFLGFEIDNLSMDETVQKINNHIIDGDKIQHVVINVAKFINSRKNELLKESITSADIINIDGAGIIYGMKILGLRPIERVTGIDLMINLLSLANKNRYSVYFLGAKDSVLNKMLFNIKLKYPNLVIAGYRNGYWDNDNQEQDVVETINKVAPNIVFVGISSPKKELFIKQYKNEINYNIIMGVGGSFDVLSGKTSRAPIFMQNYGMEWAYRLYQEPIRMWKRYLTTNSTFLLRILFEYIKRLLKK